jgi:hypothetical protein
MISVFACVEGMKKPGAIQIRCLQTIGDREIQGLSDLMPDGTPCATTIFFKSLGAFTTGGNFHAD